MNDTQQSPTASGPDDDFDAKKLRSITDMRRSKDDRIIAGVCSGAARYLNIDPVVVRVVLAVLTFAGFAGVIIYLAAWFLLPSEGAEKSVAADWLSLDKNEEQVRVAGMIGAVVLAVLSAVGDGSWAWWGSAPWWIVPFAVVAYFLWIRPRRRREAREATEAPQTVPYSAATGETTQVLVPSPPTRSKSHALLALTTSLTLIALAATWIYEETHQDFPWTTYVAVALAVVALGLLIGTFFGNGGGLILIGALLATTLAVGTVVDKGGFGEDRQVPTTATEVDSKYQHGVGLLELDLTQVDNLSPLTGRTVKMHLGIGQTRVIVPRGLNVNITSHLSVGDVKIFGRTANGTDNNLDVSSTTQPALTLDISQRIGQIEVIRK